mmetsp:Transcript_24913/g.47145  ORF Transcript_24913/g.47145 Transcript_24913/m.47145 type:complete len:217 (-) Transcript_24913:65-715(-)
MRTALGLLDVGACNVFQGPAWYGTQGRWSPGLHAHCHNGLEAAGPCCSHRHSGCYCHTLVMTEGHNHILEVRFGRQDRVARQCKHRRTCVAGLERWRGTLGCRFHAHDVVVQVHLGCTAPHFDVAPEDRMQSCGHKHAVMYVVHAELPTVTLKIAVPLCEACAKLCGFQVLSAQRRWVHMWINGPTLQSGSHIPVTTDSPEAMKSDTDGKIAAQRL